MTDERLIEGRIAERVMDAMRKLPALESFAIYANWGEDNGSGLEDEDGRVEPCCIDIKADPRAYDGFTSTVAEVKVTLDGRVDFAGRGGDVPETVYLALVGLLEEWHHSIAAVKRDLGTDNFDPVGLRLDGGEWERDRVTGARYFAQSFTVRGRISKGNRQ